LLAILFKKISCVYCILNDTIFHDILYCFAD
jgi:hypothetical protein